MITGYMPRGRQTSHCVALVHRAWWRPICVCLNDTQTSTGRIQVASWSGFQLSDAVNILHVTHKLETSDKSKQAPSVRSVTVSGATQSFQQSSWVDGHMLFAITALQQFEASLTLDLNEDDSIIDTISFAFEERDAVEFRDCYSGESIKVRSESELLTHGCRHGLLPDKRLSQRPAKTRCD